VEDVVTGAAHEKWQLWGNPCRRVSTVEGKVGRRQASSNRGPIKRQKEKKVRSRKNEEPKEAWNLGWENWKIRRRPRNRNPKAEEGLSFKSLSLTR
jgi:sRNA-binding protein